MRSCTCAGRPPRCAGHGTRTSTGCGHVHDNVVGESSTTGTTRAPRQSRCADSSREEPKDLRGEGPPGAGDARVQVYTVEQVAEILQIGRDKVYMLIRTGRLRSIKIGRLRRITDRQLTDFIAAVEGQM